MTTIKLKNGSGAPTSGDLAQGEPALDLTNKRLYTEDSGGTVIEVGTNPGVDVTFADNRKAIFGAGSDLEIYHDGSNSFIRDAGTGNLVIRGTSLNLQKDGGESYITMVADGAVTLFHDNASKLATTATGIDVTGTAVADGLTVQGASDSTLLVEATGGNDASLFLTEAGTGNVGAQFVYDGGDNELYLKVGNNSDTTRLSVSRDTGDISFYEDTGTTPKLFWDASAESLGIGTSSPSSNIDVVGNSASIGISESSGGDLRLSVTGSTTRINAYSNHPMLFSTNNTERLRIDSSGNLLVGTTTTTAGNEGMVYFNGSSLRVTRDSDEPLNLDRLSTDGAIAAFKKDGTTVGSIGTFGGYYFISGGNSGGTHAGLRFINNASIRPCVATGNDLDATLDLGTSGARFKDLYLSGGVYLGGTGSANKLDDYEEGTFTGAVSDASSGGNESSSVVNGTYVKVGAVVYVQFNVSNIDTTGMTAGNDVFITGLPFVTKSVSGTAKYTGTANLSVVTFEQTPFMQVNEGQAYVKILEVRSGAGNDAVVVSQLSSSASDIHGNLVYETA